MPSRFTASLVALPAIAGGLAVSTPASAAIELLVDPANGGALSLRATGATAEAINGYSVFSAGGFLSDLGDETLGGQFSPIVFDVDNQGSDEVAFFTLGLSDPLNPLPPVSVPDSGSASLLLNLGWTGGSADPVADLTFLYGPVDLFEPGGDQIDELEGTVVVLAETGLLGDYNDSGTVEQNDLNLVLTNWGTPRPFTDPSGQPFNTLTVDQEELNRVLTNWGSTSAGPDFTGFAVPEPGTATVAAAFLGVAAGLRRRRVKSSEIF
ncbi:MAG: PEP-CTERM sorting domain-containing protein [Planctomycetota bacterium]